MDQHDHSPKQQTHKSPFDITDPSIVRAQFAANRDASFSSYLHHHNHRHNNHDDEHHSPGQEKTEDPDQISIFDAAKYFSGLHDNNNNHHHHHHPGASPMTRLSSVSSVDTKSNYRARSFHATPTASSEASWNSQVGLLANPPGSLGISIKNISPTNINNNSDCRNTLKWPRISPKWLIPGRKCPCSGKKSVQVEERIDVKTPKMVDLRRSTSSSGTNASSYYSTRQNSLKKSGSIVPQEPTNGNFGLSPMSRKFDHIINNNNNDKPNGFLSVSSNPKVVGPMNHVNGTTTSSVSTNSFNKAVVIATNGTTTTTSNGFTFPILEDQPVGVKKMFNVISEDNQQDPYRDSLEVFQPRLSHPSPRSRRASYEEENGSDGSSDLFEIESFSTTTYPHRDSVEEASANYNASIKRFGIGMVCTSNDLVIKTPSPLQLCRNSVDDNYEPMTPSVAPTECYAPSEVSIDWSVTTAEGFDRASLTNFSVSASEIGYVAMRRELEKNGGSGGGGRKNNGSGNGGGGGGLLSCRCEKAVSVGPVPIKCQVAGGPPIPVRHVGGRHCGGKVPV